MNELQDQLIKELDTIIDLLTKHEEHNWASIFSNAQGMIDKGNIQGLDNITKMNGGMGSFNDLVICKLNGHLIDVKDENKVNVELRRLGDLVFNTTKKIKHLLNEKRA